MFFPERLDHLQIICLSEKAEAVVQTLYDFGTVHVGRAKVFSPDKPLPSFQRISEALIKLRAAETALGIEPREIAGKDEGLSALQARLDRMDFAALQATTDEFRHVSAQISSLEQRREALLPFGAFDVSPALLENKRSVDSVCFTRKKNASLKALDRLRCEYVSNGDVVLAVFDKRDAEKVNSFVSDSAVAVHPLPDFYEEAVSFAGELERVDSSLNNLRASKALLEQKLAFFAKVYGAEIGRLRAAYEVQAKKAELPSRFAASKHLRVVDAWIPARLADELEKKLAPLSVVVEKVSDGEEPPTKLRNPAPVRPFEFLIQALSLPKYEEIDPTILVSLTFPLFFGMILGDIGYGMAILPIAAFLRWKFKEGFFRDMSGMMFASAISTIIFGFVFGEFFGLEHIFGYELHPLIARSGETAGLILLMNLCVVIGVVHVALGFALGAFTAWREKHFKHAAAKLCWLFLGLGLVGLLASASDVSLLELVKPYALMSPLLAWEALAALSLLGLLVFEGATAIFELPGLIGNMVSYLRIMALGVSGVVLASMVNSIPLNFTLEPVGFVSFVLFALFFVAGHAFALVLGMFESSIQSLRLHYVEFFSKFYHGGGAAFVPLRYRKGR